MTDTASTTGIEDHTSYEGSAEQIAGVAPTALQKFDHEEFNTLKNTIDQHAPLINEVIADLLDIIAGAAGVTLASLKSETDALNGILSADDSTLDTAQERVDKIKQLLADIDSLVIADIAGLQTTLDSLQTGKEATGIAQSLVTALEATIRGAGAVGVTLTSLKSETDAISAILSSDDSTLDTAQERVDKIKQLLSDIDTLAIGDVAGLQTALDNLQTAIDGKEATGVAAALFAKLNLNAIDAEKTVTPVDIFIYDTRNDSDGGEWRYRCQATSWYNEALNTATRGSRREFPQVAVIVADASTGIVTIYDADDPYLPMWMTFTGYPGHYGSSSGGRPLTSVKAIEGMLYIGATEGTAVGGMGVNNFIADFSVVRIQVHSGYWPRPLAERNAGTTTAVVPQYFGTLTAIAGRNILGIAATVLDDAPIDQATGLPKQTIAVIHDNGLSIIRHDGEVVNGAAGLAPQFVDFAANGDVIAGWSNYLFRVTVDEYNSGSFNWDARDYRLIFLAGKGFATGIISTGIHDECVGSDNGLFKVIRTSEDVNSGGPSPGLLFAHIKSTYNMGWVTGSNVLTALCSTDTSDLVGSGELVTNSGFDTDSDWVKPAGYTISSGSLSYDGTGAQYSKPHQSLTGLIVGQLYAVQFTISGLSGGTVNFGLGNNAGNALLVPQQSYSADGTYTRYMTASVADHSVMLQNNSATQTFTIDNISVRLADDDRSVNANGLIIHGTLNRTLLGAGADMVAYSGFSSVNYQEQPYNPAMDFGTGDFTIEGWVDLQSTGYGALLHRTVEKTGTSNGLILFYFPTGVALRGAGTTCQTLTYRPMGFTYIAAVRRDGIAYLYIDGIEHASIAMPNDLTLPDATTIFGGYWQADNVVANGNDRFFNIRSDNKAKTAEQILKTYNDEKKFQNLPATLVGTSDAVAGIAFDERRNLLGAVTPSGRSEFNGLVRVVSTTDAASVIDMHDGLVVEG